MTKKIRYRSVKLFSGRGLRVYRVNDSTLEPMASRGELILADPLKPPEDGKRALVLLRGSRHVLYRFWHVKGDRVVLSSRCPGLEARSYDVPRSAIVSACKVVGTREP